jgi:hypothetical protein
MNDETPSGVSAGAFVFDNEDSSLSFKIQEDDDVKTLFSVTRPSKEDKMPPMTAASFDDSRVRAAFMGSSSPSSSSSVAAVQQLDRRKSFPTPLQRNGGRSQHQSGVSGGQERDAMDLLYGSVLPPELTIVVTCHGHDASGSASSSTSLTYVLSGEKRPCRKLESEDSSYETDREDGGTDGSSPSSSSNGGGPGGVVVGAVGSQVFPVVSSPSVSLFGGSSVLGAGPPGIFGKGSRIFHEGNSL